MKDLAHELTAAWRHLRTNPKAVQQTGDVGVFSLEGSGIPLPAWAGTGNGCQATFLLETASRPELPPPESDAMDITVEMLQARGKRRLFLSLACNRPELESVFAELCSDLARRISAGAGISAALEATLAEFRSLLREPRENICEEQVIGLIGELLILEQLCRHDRTAVASWVGAEGMRHDFRRGASAIEVKTSLRKQTRSISINAIDQLVPPEGCELHLAYVCLEKDSAGVNGLDQLCCRIRAICEPTQLEVFDQRIDKVIGLPLPKAAEHLYSLKECTAYRIAEGFPSLVPARLAKGRLDPGISRVSYDLDLSTAEAFRLTQAQWDCILEGWN